MALSRKQVHAVGASTGRVNLWDGAVRSGKTFSSILRFLAAVAQASTYGELVIVGKNKDSIYRNFFAPIENLPELAFISAQVRYRQGAATARILGRRVNVIGANDSKAESRIRGMTVVVAYVDEVTVIPEEFFKQMLARMSAPGAQLFGTTNPDAPMHWLKKNYLDRLDDLPDWRYFQFQLDDNPTLSEEYKTSLKREYTGLWYDRFILGKWVAAEGAIFKHLDPDVGGRHVIRWEDCPPLARVFGVGIDYGTTNPTSAIMLALTAEPSPRLVLLDEWKSEPSESHTLTDAEQSKRIRAFLAAPHHQRHGRVDVPYVVVDPAAASLKLQLVQDKVRGITDADNSVQHGIQLVATLLETNQLLITDRCTGWIEEAPGYVWDPKETEKGHDAPVKADDHSLDAARYIITTTEPLWRPYLQLLDEEGQNAA